MGKVLEENDEQATGLYVPDPAVLCDAQMLTPGERLLTLRRVDGLTVGHEPGQFVQVSIFALEEAPISICSAGRDEDPTFELCVRRVGRVTSALHELKVGQNIGIRGPFGRGFPVDELAGKDVLFVAGGIGLPPLRSLVQHCLGHRERFGKLTLLYGTRRRSDLLFADDLQQWARAERFNVETILEEGDEEWTGPVGLITTLIPPLELDPQRTTAVIVGPPVMYRFVIEELVTKGLHPQQIVLSLERHMRCGVGKCGHCMIGELYCCRDGPVFKLSEVADIEGAI